MVDRDGSARPAPARPHHDRRPARSGRRCTRSAARTPVRVKISRSGASPLCSRSSWLGALKWCVGVMKKVLTVRFSAHHANLPGCQIRQLRSGAAEVGWHHEYNTSLSSVLQDLTAWEKRSRHEEGKDDVPWDITISNHRRYGPSWCLRLGIGAKCCRRNRLFPLILDN